MHKIVKDPLIHFMLLGFIIYGVFLGASNYQQDVNPIVISEGKVKQLITMYKKIWQREPNSTELDHLIQEYVLEQVAYHEGVALGLDLNDIVIMRRVRQKLDFIAEESLPRPQPTEKVLQDYLNQHPDKFRPDDLYTFRHIYFDKNQQLDAIYQANELLTKLHITPNKDITNLGQGYSFKSYYQAKTEANLANVFGKKFSQTLVSVPTKKWYGPLQSEFGSHLIYIEKREHVTQVNLSDIRARVLSEWEHELRKQATSRFYQKLLAKYNVTIKWPLDHHVVN
jgi:hypothetical protein